MPFDPIFDLSITMNSKYKVLDLFCGCGGLSAGFKKAGFSIVAGIDVWSVAIDTFRQNHAGSLGLVKDLTKYSADDLKAEYQIGAIDGIIGGPPCQGFSISGKRDPKDPRNKLYQEFLNYIDFMKPKFFVMENVPNLVSMAQGKIKKQILKDLENLDYKVSYRILLASDYGVPQNRKRVFFVGFKDGQFDFDLLTPIIQEAKVTSCEAISDLPESSMYDGEPYRSNARSEYQRYIRRNSEFVFNHHISKHTEKTKEIISLVPDGGNYKDLPLELKGTRKVNIAWTRLDSSKPSFTIDTGHRHHFHYRYNRIPTVREAARLQSFSDDFIFTGAMTNQHKQVGNAVPPILANRLALSIIKQLKNQPNV